MIPKKFVRAPIALDNLPARPYPGGLTESDFLTSAHILWQGKAKAANRAAGRSQAFKVGLGPFSLWWVWMWGYGKTTPVTRMNASCSTDTASANSPMKSTDY